MSSSAVPRPLSEPESNARAKAKQLPKICLRRFRDSDLVAFQSYRHDPQVGEYQGWTPQSDEESLSFLREMETIEPLQHGAWTQYAIVDASMDDQLLLGDVGIYISDDGSESELGFSLARSSQGRGVATAAMQAACDLVFSHTKAISIYAQTDARNAACIRLMDRFHAKQVARLDTIYREQPCVELRYLIASRTKDDSCKHDANVTSQSKDNN